MLASKRLSAAGSKPSRSRSRARCARWEQAQHHLLAEEGRQARHAEVDVPLGPYFPAADPDSTVLREPSLRDVEPGHHLEPGGDGVPHRRRRSQRMVEHAVDAVADPYLVFVRLDVDVARALLDGGGQHDVHEPDHRRFVTGRLGRSCGLTSIAAVHGTTPRGRRRVRPPGLGGRRSPTGRRDPRRGNAVVPSEGREQLVLGSHDRLDGAPGRSGDLLESSRVGRIRGGDDQHGSGAIDRHELVRPGQTSRDELDHPRVDVEVPQGDGGHAVLPAQQGAHLILGGEAQLDQVETQPPPVHLLGRQGRLDLFRADALLRDEQLTESRRHGPPPVPAPRRGTATG